jgi:nucleoside-diphosphate-sugar epimerase
MAVKKVLVTGGSGYIGNALFKRLQRESVTVFSGVRGGCIKTGEIPMPDLLGNVDWSDTLESFNVVIHTAGRAHIFDNTSKNCLESFRKINTVGTLKLARSAVQCGVKKFIFISSIGVNGLITDEGNLFSESDKPNPHNNYALSKWEAEEGLMQIASETCMEIVIIRPPLVYGPHAPGNFGLLTRAVRRGRPLPLGAVHNKRSLVALDNLLDLIVTCLHHPAAANQTFLVSDGQDLSTTELVRGMARVAGVPARLWPVPLWALQAAAGALGMGPVIERLCGNLQVDITKARTVLGWVPPVSVDEGLLRAMGDYEKIV